MYTKEVFPTVTKVFSHEENHHSGVDNSIQGFSNLLKHKNAKYITQINSKDLMQNFCVLAIS